MQFVGESFHLIAKSNDIISADNLFQSANIFGYLVDAYVQPVIFDVNIEDYIVPEGKNLFIYHGYSPPSNSGPPILKINNFQAATIGDPTYGSSIFH